MLEVKLTPCATMLYHWILRKFPNSDQRKIDLQDFQAWSGEYRDNAYSDREIFEALQQLKKNHLVSVSHTEVTLGVRLGNPKIVAPQSSSPLLGSQTNSASDRSAGYSTHPRLLISLITITSFIFGFVPIALGLSICRGHDTTHISGKPETILARPDSNSSFPHLK